MPIDQYAGYADYSQQDFVDEAQPKDVQGSGAAPGATQPASGGNVASSIVWSDGASARPEGPAGQLPGSQPGAAGSETMATEGVQSEETIAATTAETTKNDVLAAGGDDELATAAAQVVGPAKGVESYLANLNEQIDKQQNKRKKARLLAFGLALLGGESMSSALSVANQTPFFDDDDLDQLLDQRKDLMGRLHADYLNSQGVYTSGVQDKILKDQSTLQLEKAKMAIKDSGMAGKWDIGSLTEAQGKSLALGNEAITGAAEMTAIEQLPDFNPGGIAEKFREALARDGDGNVTGLRAAILNKYAPEEAAYIRATMKYVTAKLRKESGAAISAGEWATEFAKMVPANAEEFKYKQEYRNRGIKALATSAGAPDVHSFSVAAGFDEGSYNATQWAQDVLGIFPDDDSSLPQAAKDRVKEGKVVEFNNGQQWTRKDGKLVRIK